MSRLSLNVCQYSQELLTTAYQSVLGVHHYIMWVKSGISEVSLDAMLHVIVAVVVVVQSEPYFGAV